ncbi:Cyclin-dependent kinase [Heracleum sosnowskyi]|uniref:cyclin-dependent kinase n=1 Tax=Heracleum sosnowskyi TaxID=360622 RepID=A0AAD8MTS2_9APIA|nr:Cyclin-dependent kinase [Heracleum sosnowskyi]
MTQLTNLNSATDFQILRQGKFISVETMARCIKREAEARGLSENKKRKYSPIVWDRDDKVVFPFLQVVYKDCAELHNIGSCRWVDDVEEGEIFESPADKGVKLVGGDMGVSKKLISPQFVVERKREGSEGKSFGSSDKGSNHSLLTDECDMEIDGQQNCGDSSVGHLNTDTDVECGFWETPEPAATLQRSVNMPQACRSVNEFERLKKLGEGTYGVVYKARNKKTGEIVALKKVKMDNHTEGFPLTSLREINILRSSDHPSIIDLKEVVEGSSSDCVFLVMEYMDSDLGEVMRRRKNQPFCQSEVKCLMLQLLKGVKYLHDNWVLHRDLKTSNLLLNRRGELKICDLGMARQYGSPAKPYTQLVVTLWYRAPELLLGAKQYSTEVDMWSVGCIMAELLLNQPLFNGDNEIKQIDKIFRMLGTPNETSWPGFSELPEAKARFVKQPDNLLRKKFPAASFTGAAPLSNAGFDLLNKLLTCDPAKRITADEALNHQWFREFPLPKSKDCMPTF